MKDIVKASISMLEWKRSPPVHLTVLDGNPISCFASCINPEVLSIQSKVFYLIQTQGRPKTKLLYGNWSRVRIFPASISRASAIFRLNGFKTTSSD
jgi:hypothetical protein